MEELREYPRMIPKPHVKTLDKEIGEIDFGEPAIRIERLIRGLNPRLVHIHL